jgi:ATP phosphoribosyltransferase
MRKIVVALPKENRLFGKAYGVFRKAGFACAEFENGIEAKQRKQLAYTSDDGQATFILARAADIPQYVDKNWADVGVSAFDNYREYELSHVTAKSSMRGDNFMTDILPDLKLCENARFCVSGQPELKDFYEKCKTSDEKIITVATQHPNIAAKYFSNKGITADIVTITGSSEVMPKYGEVDAIFDIVETGGALKENGLVIFEEAMPIQTKVLVSKAAFKYDENVGKMIEVLKNAIK